MIILSQRLDTHHNSWGDSDCLDWGDMRFWDSPVLG